MNDKEIYEQVDKIIVDIATTCLDTRVKSGLTVTEFAEQLGIDKTIIYRVENIADNVTLAESMELLYRLGYNIKIDNTKGEIVNEL